MSESTKPKSVFDQIDGGEIAGTDVPAEVTEARKEEKTTKVFKKPVTTLVEAQAAPSESVADLVAILMRREARDAAAAEELLLNHKARMAQRNKNAREQDSKILLKQARCKHLKGGKAGPRNQQIDYAVAAHVFINATVYIRCLVCGMRWYQEDTKEYLVRRGHKIANHTHKGWIDAVQMTMQSSNTQTKSEMLVIASSQTSIAKNLDLMGIPVNEKVVDLEGNPVEGVEL